MGQVVTTLADENPINNSLEKPIIIEDVVLLCPGVWVGEDNRPTEYTAEQIKSGFQNTDWENMNLFLDHKDTKSSAVSAWVGFVRNVRILGDELMGDLEIWHPLISLFIKKAKARFGVSATMQGEEKINNMGGTSEYIIHSFRSMSLVDEPGCKISWLPKVLSKGKDGDKNVIVGMSVEKILAAHGMLTSVNDGHSHTWTKDSKVTSESDGHTHPLDLSTMKAKEVEGHTHNLLDKSVDVEENAAHGKKKKDMDSNLKSMKGGKIEMEKVNEKKVEGSKTKNLSSETEESKENEGSENNSSEEVKNLSNKVDKLTDVVASISETLKTLSADNGESEDEEPAKEESSEEPDADSSTESSESSESSEEEKSEDSSDGEDANKELVKARNEIGNSNDELVKVKKELSSLKEELNSPDKKTLASSDVNIEASSIDANAGMLGFLREKANIPIY